MQFSEKCEALFAAMALVQGEAKDPTRDRQADVGRYKYKFSSLSDVLPELRPITAKHGLAFITDIKHVEGSRHEMEVLITHSSGQWLRCTYPYVVDKPADPQACGSAITYARRYAVLNAFGLAQADSEDDDGKAAADAARGKSPDRKGETREQKQARQDQHDKDWEGERSWFMGQIAELGFGYDEVCEFCDFLKLKRPSSQTSKTRHSLIDRLKTVEGADKYNEFLDSRTNTNVESK